MQSKRNFVIRTCIRSPDEDSEGRAGWSAGARPEFCQREYSHASRWSVGHVSIVLPARATFVLSLTLASALPSPHRLINQFPTNHHQQCAEIVRKTDEKGFSYPSHRLTAPGLRLSRTHSHHHSATNPGLDQCDSEFPLCFFCNTWIRCWHGML